MHSPRTRTKQAPVRPGALPPPLRQVDRTCVLHRGRHLAYFGGCDYFRMASHLAVLEAVEAAVRQYGLSVSASRMTTGNHPLYERVEAELARFFGCEAAVITGNGYSANLVAAQALAHDKPVQIFLDERAHPSLQDAATLTGVKVNRFSHKDVRGLSKLLARRRAANPVVLTDGFFAHNGSLAPLAEYACCLEGRGQMLIDDAHGLGVLGARGRGTAEQVSMPAGAAIITGTLSKAFGSYGGVLLCSADFASQVREVSRMYIGHTPPPLPLMAGALKAVELLRKDKGYRTRLHCNSATVKSILRPLCPEIPDNPSPLIRLCGTHPDHAAAVRKALLKAGIYPSQIRYPGGPPGGFFRFALSSEHTVDQVTLLAGVLERAIRLGQLAAR